MFQISALFFVKPPSRRMKKSPISWGISWAATAIAVAA